jgi:hypothetical protein
MSDVIIRVENLGKCYRIPHQGERQHYVALCDVIAQKAKSFFRSRKSAVSGQTSDLSPSRSLRAVGRSPTSALAPTSDLRPPRWLHFHILSPKVIML